MRRALLFGSALLMSGCSLNICTPEPIEGYWSSPAGAVVQIKKNGSDFQGVIVQKRTQGECPEPVGDVLFKLSGSGQHYTGQWQWWQAPSCNRKFAGGATLDLKNGNDNAHVCSKDPFGGGGSQCLDFKRVSNFQTSASPR